MTYLDWLDHQKDRERAASRLTQVSRDVWVNPALVGWVRYAGDTFTEIGFGDPDPIVVPVPIGNVLASLNDGGDPIRPDGDGWNADDLVKWSDRGRHWPD